MNEELRVRTEELDAARVFLEGILSSVGAGVVVLDRDLKVTSWNSGAVDLWGLRGDEAIGQPFFSLDFGLPTDSLRTVVHECLDTGKRGTPRYVASVSRLGKSLRCAVLTSPFDGDGGGVVMLMEESSGDASART